MRSATAFGKATSAIWRDTQVQNHSTYTKFANNGQVSICSNIKSTTLTSRSLSVNPVRGVHSAVTEVDPSGVGGAYVYGES